MVFAMAAVLASWLVLIAAFIGTGALLLRWLGVHTLDTDRVLSALLLGISVAIALLQIWHFWRPIDALALVTVLIAGAAGLVVCRRAMASWLTSIAGHWRALAVFGLVVLWCANRAIGPGDSVDSGFYHYQAIHWSNTYAVVPGIGNLNPRLAYNSTSLLLQALVNADGTPWHGRAPHIGNGVMLVALFGLAVTGAARVLRRNAAPVARADIYATMLIVPAVLLALSKEISSPRTDLPPAVFGFFIVWRLLAMLDTGDGSVRRADLFFVTIAAATAVCLKLTTSAFALTAWATVAVIWTRAEHPNSSSAARATGTCALVSLMMIGPWIGRGYVQSGYPLFPSTVLGADVDWKIPEAVGHEQSAKIHRWSRVVLAEFAISGTAGQAPSWLVNAMRVDDPEGAAASLDWIRPWLVALIITAPMNILAPASICVVVLLSTSFRRHRPTPALAPAVPWIAAVPPAIGVACWFAVAPDPRFGYGVLWSLAAVLSALAWPAEAPLRARTRLVIACCLMTIPACVHRTVANWYLYDAPLFSNVPFYGAGPDHGFHPLPQQTYESFTTRFGLVLQEPVDPPLLAWDGPLLAVPDRRDAAGVRLRVEGDLSKGFRGY